MAMSELTIRRELLVAKRALHFVQLVCGVKLRRVAHNMLLYVRRAPVVVVHRIVPVCAGVFVHSCAHEGRSVASSANSQDVLHRRTRSR